MSFHMLFNRTFVLIMFIVLSLSHTFAGTYITTDSGRAEIPYCQGDDCGLEKGVNVIRSGVSDDLETDRSFSVYIQAVIVYALSFLSLLAVIYIIYAGFQILIGNGDEEKLKKSKQTIIYVVLGILIIWAAWLITDFILRILLAGEG